MTDISHTSLKVIDYHTWMYQDWCFGWTVADSGSDVMGKMGSIFWSRPQPLIQPSTTHISQASLKVIDY
jgi:hypothetical protein